MIKLVELSLFDLLPTSLANDKNIKVLCEALDRQLTEITGDIRECILIPRIDELSEQLVDYFATQLHVDFYKPLGLDLDTKKALVKKSLIAHKFKGTRYSIETVLKTLYGDNVTVVPWFEYGGEPYHFKIMFELSGVGDEPNIDEMFLAIECYKSARDIGDGLNYYADLTETLKFGVGILEVKKVAFTECDSG